MSGGAIQQGIFVVWLMVIGMTVGGCSLSEVSLFDKDEDGLTVGVDCDDTDPQLGARFEDLDGDGFGQGSPLAGCHDLLNEGFTDSGGDCDDYHQQSYPSADEVCDGLDNDCNGQIDDGFPTETYYLDGDGDGYGMSGSAIRVEACVPPEGYSVEPGDCNDNNRYIYPGAAEYCDEYDNDCNGTIDEDCGSICPIEGCPVLVFLQSL